MSPVSAPSVTKKLTIVVDYDDRGMPTFIHAQHMIGVLCNNYTIGRGSTDLDFIGRLLVEIYGMIQRTWSVYYD
jgi:hypothetical protein